MVIFNATEKCKYYSLKVSFTHLNVIRSHILSHMIQVNPPLATKAIVGTILSLAGDAISAFIRVSVGSSISVT